MANIKFNPCRPCCVTEDGICTVHTDCCNSVPCSLTLVHDCLYSYNPGDTGTFYTENLPNNNIEVQHMYSGDGWETWGGALGAGRSRQCGDILHFYFMCDDNVFGVPNFSGFQTLNYANPPQQETPIDGGCGGTDFNLLYTGVYRFCYTGEYSPNQNSAANVKYGAPYSVPYPSGCCDYLHDENLDLWRIGNVSISGALSSFNNLYFSGDFLNTHAALHCKENTSDTGPLRNWPLTEKVWSFAVNRDVLSTLRFLDNERILSYVSPCYPFLLRATENEYDWVVSRQDSSTVNGIPTYLTDGRHIPKTIYGSFEHLEFNGSGDCGPINIQDIPLIWESGTRNWIPGETTRCFDFPDFGEICSQAWIPTVCKSSCSDALGNTGQLVGFGPYLQINNPFRSDWDFEQTEYSNSACLETSLGLTFWTDPPSVAGRREQYVDLVSGWDIASIDPLLLRAVYRFVGEDEQTTQYFCSGDTFYVEITE